MTTTEEKSAAKDEELAEQARQYVNLRNELVERGKELADKLVKRGARTFFIEVNGEHFELVKTYAATGRELPVSVNQAELL